jgi:ABC-type bacteriocin/lantibiotic exporter with double-glycine peptidase domain
MFNKKKKTEERKFESNLEMGFLRVKKELSNNKKISFLIIFLVIGGNIFYSSLKFLLGKIIDYTSSAESILFFNFEFNGSTFFLAIFAIFIVIDTILDNLRFHYFEPLLGFKLYQKYFLDIFRKVSNFPTSFFKKVGVGKISYTITKSSSIIEKISPQVFNLIGLFAEILVSLFFVFIISPPIFLFLFGMFSVYVIVFLFTKNNVSKLSDEHNEKRKNVSEKLIEKINLIFEVKKNNNEHAEDKNNKNNILKERSVFYKKNTFGLKVSLLNSSLYIIITLGALFMSIYFYKNGQMTIGEVSSINLYAMFLV